MRLTRTRHTKSTQKPRRLRRISLRLWSIFSRTFRRFYQGLLLGLKAYERYHSPCLTGSDQRFHMKSNQRDEEREQSAPRSITISDIYRTKGAFCGCDLCVNAWSLLSVLLFYTRLLALPICLSMLKGRFIRPPPSPFS